MPGMISYASIMDHDKNIIPENELGDLPSECSPQCGQAPWIKSPLKRPGQQFISFSRISRKRKHV